LSACIVRFELFRRQCELSYSNFLRQVEFEEPVWSEIADEMDTHMVIGHIVVNGFHFRSAYNDMRCIGMNRGPIIGAKGKLESTSCSLRFSRVGSIVIAVLEIERTRLDVEATLGYAAVRLGDVDVQVAKKGESIAESQIRQVAL
jgi:hypothetical protein